jgi:serine/threonine protein kinase
MSSSGVVKIGDFGLAKSFARDGRPLSEAKSFARDKGGVAGGGEARVQQEAGKVVEKEARHALEQQQQQQQHTRGVGTVLYASPQQLAGQSCGPEADIFSLGVIIIELFLPFGSGMERVISLSQASQVRLPKAFVANFPHVEVCGCS